MILSTLDTNKSKRIYLLSTILCFVFSMIYEHFSHKVYSPYMVFALGIPLIGGLAVIEIFSCFPNDFYPNHLSINLYNSGLATFTVGSLLQGALEIYGTENPLMIYYWYAGILLTAGAIVSWFLSLLLRFRKNNKRKGSRG